MDTALSNLYAARTKIAANDKNGPCLNAVLELNPQAEGIAAALDAESARNIKRPLHAMPILLKDNIDTADMMHTSAGSLALKNRTAPRDAFIVTKLREAGALLLGKANMTEFANYMADNMPNGYSSRGGQVKNPWGDFDPSGSSTGSAVAVAAGYVSAAIGTETLGSIISPACEAGIAAVKPTVGLVSRSGILPISISQDTAGPMARTMLDCARVLDIISGPDPSDPCTLVRRAFDNFEKHALKPGSLQGMTLGLLNEDYEGNPVTNAPFMKSLDLLSNLGAEIIDVELPKFKFADTAAVMSNEFRTCMDYALRSSVGCPLTLAEIVAYNRENSSQCLKYGQKLLEEALMSEKSMSNPAYLKARSDIYENMYCAIGKLYAERSLEAIITPCASFFPVAGFPSVTIPVGVHEGKPVSIVFNGLSFSEGRLISIAAALEGHVAFENPPSHEL